MQYKKILTRLLRYPEITGEICDYLKNDFLTSTGAYRYPYNILYVNGLIKSGSSWLGNMLAMIPGYNLRPINDPEGKTRSHDISEPVFSSLPKKRYSVMKLHTRFSEENFEIIKKYVPKFVVTHRDLRDVCVARYFYVLADPKNELHNLYKSITKEEGISYSIDTVRDFHAPWVNGWTNAASSNPEMILVVRYEDLNSDTTNTLNRVLNFFDIKADNGLINRMADTKIRKEKDLAGALKKDLPGKLRSTARKGIVGDWKNHFTKEHKNKFKQVAGGLLVELGYEKDDNW